MKIMTLTHQIKPGSQYEAPSIIIVNQAVTDAK